ncbi:pyruvate dehydrogenase X component [Roridomyces roridus]|uniref:Pyruvate dehydrogenase X component n=1 Tax=Roridomyces roridus TaxID=1738132 RepID=A0AAD7B5R8_9AGAR|nr:pyruvate dehydrogenase X component [Roridomyces roridus]
MSSLTRAVLRRALHQSHARRAITNLEMPAMSPTMTEGGISSWKKKEGEAFSAGDVLLEIETDKATIDVEAQDDGVLGKILVQDGSKNILVGKKRETTSRNLEAPKEEASPRRAQQPASSPTPSTPPPAPQSKPAETSHHSPPSHTRPLFPSVHRLLMENGISEASKIKGTGVRGMLTKGDVLTFLGKASGPLGTYKESPPPTAQAQPKKEEPKPLDGSALRQLIVSTLLQNSIKARNPPPASFAQADFDSVLADYFPPTTPKPKPASSVPPPSTPKSTAWLDGLI